MNHSAFLTQTEVTANAPGTMEAVRVHAFGGLDAMTCEQIAPPLPGPGQVLVRVAAAGVGPWDAWVRAGRSVIAQPLPLTLGADLAGTVEAVGEGVTGYPPGTAVYGATNARFTGAYAQYAIAEASMIARRPDALGVIEAASVPVVACTALQMLFEHGGVDIGQTVVVIGGAGNVGAYAVQLAVLAGARVFATGRTEDLGRITLLGAMALDAQSPMSAEIAGKADVVLDTVGGAALAGAFAWLRPGGRLVSSVAEPDREAAALHRVIASFVLVEVTTQKLEQLGDLFAAGLLRTNVGAVLPLRDARRAHALMESGTAPSGKLVLVP